MRNSIKKYPNDKTIQKAINQFYIYVVRRQNPAYGRQLPLAVRQLLNFFLSKSSERFKK